jgi:hypothetical protein
MPARLSRAGIFCVVSRFGSITYPKSPLAEKSHCADYVSAIPSGLISFGKLKGRRLFEGIWMKRLVAFFLCVLFPVCAFAGDNSYKITYDGGSIAGAKAGTNMKLFIEGSNVKIVSYRSDIAIIPAVSITEITYGQDVHRRIGAAIGVAVFSLGIGALLALTKSKKHFVGLTWDDKGQKGGFAFQANKDDYRGLLAGLEGITGKKAVDSDTMTVKN